MGISAKLLDLIGEESVQNWAERHGLAKQTVHEWIKHDRTPGKNSLTILSQATGKSVEWWLAGEDGKVKRSKVKRTEKQYIEKKPVTGSGFKSVTIQPSAEWIILATMAVKRSDCLDDSIKSDTNSVVDFTLKFYAFLFTFLRDDNRNWQWFADHDHALDTALKFYWNLINMESEVINTPHYTEIPRSTTTGS